MGRKAGMDDAFSAAENRTMHELSREFGVILHTHAYGGDVEFLHETTPEALCPSLSLTTAPAFPNGRYRFWPKREHGCCTVPPPGR